MGKFWWTLSNMASNAFVYITDEGITTVIQRYKNLI